MEGQDQSPRILCRAREIGRNETSQAKMEFSWGKRNLHTRRTRAPPPPPPWNTGMCEHLPPSASASASSFLNAESANNFKERPTDGYGMQQRQRRRRHMLLASLAFFVGSLLEVHVQVGCIFLSEWGISLWRDGGRRHDMRPCVDGGRKVAHIHHLHE